MFIVIFAAGEAPRLFNEFTVGAAVGGANPRTVRPLALHFLGERWTLAAWCELRKDFRNFRLDRIRELLMRDETFQHESGKTLEDFLRCMKGGG